MGKKSKQRPADTAAAPVVAAAPAAGNGTGSGDAAVPLLSEDALSKLTQTIQSGFEKAKQQEEKANARGKGARLEKKEKTKKSKDDKKKKQDDDDDKKQDKQDVGEQQKKDDRKDATEKKKDRKDRKGKVDAAEKKDAKQDKKDTADKKDKKDKKDTADKKDKKDKKDRKDKKEKTKTKDLIVGKPSSSTPTTDKSKPAPTDRGQKRSLNGETKPQAQVLPPKRGIDKAMLLKEIVELGGTQEDLDLVKDIESDSELDEVEFAESKKAEKGLTEELAGFMKEIGLEGKFAVADAESEDEEDEEEEDEGEEDEEEDGEEDEEEEEDKDMAEASAPEPPAPAKAAPPVTTFAAPTDPASKNSKLLFTPRPDWHAFALPALEPPAHPPSPSQIEALHRHGKHLLTTENTTYSTSHLTKSSDRQFLSTIMTSGTLTDKISALTLICQESPLHTTKTLETLLGLARKKSRSQAVSAMGAIKDLFASGVVLPPGRKLRFFNKQPGLGSTQASDLHMLVWAYEDWLKTFYFEILKTLEALCSDQLEFARTHAVGYVWELLKEKPEQEANLLRLLVNKLGDTDKKVSSKVSYLLLKLQSTHPAMKSIIISSIESEVVFRPGNSVHAKYYAIITLNQTILSTREVDVANRLLNLYFAVFTGILKKDNNTPAATGVNASGLGSHTKFADDDKEEEKKSWKGGKGGAPPSRRGGKLNRKAKLRREAEEKKEQFAEELNAKLISAVLAGVNRAFPFSQVEDEVFQKHMDTLFRITHSGNFNTSIQALMLIFQVANSKQAVSDRFYRTLYESLLDQRLVTSSKQAMYLNLLFKALKADTQIKRVRAFVKRLIQISTFHQPPFICGVLFLLSELETAIPSLHQLMDTAQETLEDEEEVFRDVPEEGEEKPTVEEKSEEKRVEYDGRKRDPSHANADRSCLWEILPFLNYYHPSVALFATSLLSKSKMPSKPDLGMHTLTHFLDRFVYRAAKSSVATTARGASIMQPLDGGDMRGMVLSTRAAGKTQVPVNSDTFWRRRVEDVPVDEVFFHKYFNQAAPKKTTAAEKKKKKEEEDAAADSEAEEEANEEEIWKAMVGSRPELGGAEMDSGDEGADFDDDEDMDLDDAEGEGEDEDEEEEGGVAVDEDDDGSDVPDFGADDGDDVWSDDDDVPDALDKAFEAELQAKTKAEAEAAGETDTGNDRRKKRRKLKNLPTFASAEDYAHMLSD
ncbi:CBF/Mak21 family-domain-containing protein [Morchella snyderi]|nr:CBF/Mak21 family-domain-containing protein [Morchella snyderi]